MQINAFQPWQVEVLAIDDASTDEIQAVLAPYQGKLPLTVIRHPQNRGLTGGINTAFEYFWKKLQGPDAEEYLGFGLMDGDDSHNPHLLYDMVDRLLQGHDVVIASRYREGSQIFGVSWFRQLTSLGLALIFKSLRNIPCVRDYSCGYRLYSPHIVRLVREKYGDVVVEEKSFASMVEILIKCHMVGAIFGEVPMLLRYDLKRGVSKMRVWATIKGNLKLLVFLRKSEKYI